MGVWVLNDSSIVKNNKSLLKGQSLVGCQQCSTGNLRVMVMPGRLAVAMHKNPSSPKTKGDCVRQSNDRSSTIASMHTRTLKYLPRHHRHT